MPATTRGQKGRESFVDDLSSKKVAKTPVNKTPKGKQSLSTKKVSFQMDETPSGKMSNKSKKSAVKVQHSLSPKKNTPLISKNTKDIKSAVKNSDLDDSDDDSFLGDEDEFDMELGDFMDEDEDSDGDFVDIDDGDDEDDDDSDDEVEISKSTKKASKDSNPEKKKPVANQKEPKSKQKKTELDVLLDKDEDSDFDVDTDEDESDDGDDEAEISKSTKKANAVSQPQKQKELKSKQKKSASNQDEDENADDKKSKSKKGKSQQSIEQTTFVAFSKDEKEKLTKMDAERRNKRHLRLQKSSLFLRKLAEGVTIEDLKSLSPDIVNVYYCRNLKKMRAAYLHFPSEASANKNLNLLESKSLKGKSLHVGLSLPKSGQEAKAKGLDFRKLQVVDLPSSVKIAEIAPFFPKACQIQLDVDVGFREAIITYANPMEAKEEFENVKVEVNGRKVDVFYCTFRRIHGKRKRKSKTGGSEESAKRKKTSK